jgi:acetyl esterase/lipase
MSTQSRDLGVEGQWEEWYGLARFRLDVDGYRAFVMAPVEERPDRARPWVWYSPTFLGPNPTRPETNPGQLAHPAEVNAWLLARLLAAGFWVAGVEIGESFGSPAGREAHTKFYRFVTGRLGLTDKVCLYPQSRGGLMHYNWAVEHPKWVQCVAGIYPVTDVRTWPGPAQLERVAEAYGMAVPEWQSHLTEHNPVERLAPLAAQHVPVLHIHGDSDAVVPAEANTQEFARRYRTLGGSIEVIIVPGGQHDRSPLFFENERVCAFLLTCGV